MGSDPAAQQWTHRPFAGISEFAITMIGFPTTLLSTTSSRHVRFSTRVRNALTSADWTTVGEIREGSDATLLAEWALSPIFVKRWACRRQMACDQPLGQRRRGNDGHRPMRAFAGLTPRSEHPLPFGRGVVLPILD